MKPTSTIVLWLTLIFACEADPTWDIADGTETGGGVEIEGAWTDPSPSPDPSCDTRPGSIGCECPASGCLENLECLGGFCGPCPAEQYGCECGPGDTCEGRLVCDDGVCVRPMSTDWP